MSVLVFDVGATNLRIAIGTGWGLKKTWMMPVPRTWISAINVFRQIREELPTSTSLTAVAGCVPGVVNQKLGRLDSAPNIKAWNRKPIRDDLKKIFDCPVYLENDAAVAGLGEAKFGNGRGYPIVAYITIGTGVGGARIVNGGIDQRAAGFEPGHQIIQTGKHGRAETLEDLVSGRNIKRRFHIKAEKLTTQRIWRQLSWELAIGLVNVVELWSPDVIVLGGAVMAKYKKELLFIKKIVREHLQSSSQMPIIKLGRFGQTAGLYGALALAKKK